MAKKKRRLELADLVSQMPEAQERQAPTLAELLQMDRMGPRPDEPLPKQEFYNMYDTRVMDRLRDELDFARERERYPAYRRVEGFYGRSGMDPRTQQLEPGFKDYILRALGLI
jgi:hypothetical protein